MRTVTSPAEAVSPETRSTSILIGACSTAGRAGRSWKWLSSLKCVTKVSNSQRPTSGRSHSTRSSPARQRTTAPPGPSDDQSTCHTDTKALARSPSHSRAAGLAPMKASS